MSKIIEYKSNLAREKFHKLGLNRSGIYGEEVLKLKELLEIELDNFNNNGFTMKLEKTCKKDFEFNSDGSIKKYYFKVRGNYFRKREAISFNSDGFIGFAGWADSTNIQPFLIAFDKWVDYKYNKQ